MQYRLWSINICNPSRSARNNTGVEVNLESDSYGRYGNAGVYLHPVRKLEQTFETDPHRNCLIDQPLFTFTNSLATDAQLQGVHTVRNVIPNLSQLLAFQRLMIHGGLLIIFPSANPISALECWIPLPMEIAGRSLFGGTFFLLGGSRSETKDDPRSPPGG